MGITVFVVVIDQHGEVADYKSINGTRYKDIQILSKAVSDAHTDLEKIYPEPEYNIHVGVADSLPNFLRSFPEVTQVHQLV